MKVQIDDDTRDASLNPLLSEAGFSTGTSPTGSGGRGTCLNPLLSEAGFSTSPARRRDRHRLFVLILF